MPLRAPGSARADIAILTVIPPELFAAREALGIAEASRSKDEAGTISYRGKVRSTLAGRDYDVVLTCLGRAGNAVSAAAVQDVISRYQPRAVLLMGIAAGMRGKVKIGEVVLSERIVAYEPAALVRTPEGASRQEPRPEIQVIPHRMSQDVTHYRPEPARLQQRFEKHGGSFPQPEAGKEALYQEHVAAQVTVKSATIASGEKLLRDPAKLLEVRALHGKTEVGEMEAVGLMEACQRSEVPWLVIRGISDFGDELKDDRFHDLASRAAAAVLADFIENGLELSASSPRLPGPRRWMALALGAVLLAGGVGLYAGSSHGKRQSPSGICESDLGPSPFKRPEATHLLVAHFQGSSPSEKDFSEVVSTQVMHALNAYKEEALSSPQEVDIEVPIDSLEIARVGCVIESHDQAEAVARALNANVVIWGQAFFNPGNQNYTVSPKATLHRAENSLRRGGESKMELESLGHLDLPALRFTEPFLLVQFALGLHFYEKGNYWLAARFFEKSAEGLLPKERGAVEIKLALGVAYYHLPDMEKSLSYSRTALGEVSGSGSQLEGVLINNIGSVLESQGKYEEALKHYRQALAIDEKALGKDHPSVAARLNNIGSALEAQGEYGEALKHYQQALAISEKALGKDHLSVASLLNNIGSVLEAQGEYGEALKHFRQALAIDEKALGTGHPDVAIDLNNIGSALKAQGEYGEALKHYRQALAIDEKALGKDHHSVAARLNNIGSVLETQGEYVEALKHFRQALAISEKALGKDHLSVAVLLNNIGSALKAQGEYVEALKHFRQALAIDEKTLGKGHPDVAIDLNNIGSVLETQGEYVEALKHFRQALAISEKALGKDHRSVATRLNNIGSVLEAQGEYGEALKHYRQALAISERALGKDHLSVAALLNNIGSALKAQGEYGEALKHFRQALAISEKALGKDHHSVAALLNNIGRALEAQGEYGEALKHFRQALAISEKALGKDHPTTRTIRENLASASPQ